MPAQPMYKRILITTDGSLLSRKAISGAIDLAASLDSELIALHIVPKYPMSYANQGIAFSRRQADFVEKQWADRGEELVTAVRDAAAARGVKSRGIVLQSNAVADTVIGAARKHKCDLIVMASHGRKGLKRILLGSETQHVLTGTNIPTLVMR
jgi:nucleotide-binding universal stress UspA family protein